MHRQTLLSALPTWNGTAQYVDQKPTDVADLELAHMVVVHIFKGSGFTLIGNLISSFQNLCLSSGKNSAIVTATLTWGHTWCQKCIKFHCDKIVDSWEGKSWYHVIAHTFSQKITLQYLSNICLEK